MTDRWTPEDHAYLRGQFDAADNSYQIISALEQELADLRKQIGPEMMRAALAAERKMREAAEAQSLKLAHENAEVHQQLTQALQLVEVLRSIIGTLARVKLSVAAAILGSGAVRI